MITLRAKAGAAATAVMLTVGCALTLGIMTATHAHAAADICPNQVYNGIIHTETNNYLDSYGGGSETYVHTYRFTGSNNQTWCVQKASETRGGFFIHPDNNPTGLCLDAHQNSAGYPMWVYTCNDTNPQRWCWNGDGYITRWDAADLALKDTGRYNVVQLAKGDANPWYTNGAEFSDNC